LVEVGLPYLVIVHIIIGMPPQHIIIGIPAFIIAIMQSQHCLNISIVMPVIGFISQVMPVSVMVQVICAIIIGIMPPIIGFIIGLIIGIMLFIIGMGIGIMAGMAVIVVLLGPCRAVVVRLLSEGVSRFVAVGNGVSTCRCTFLRSGGGAVGMAGEFGDLTGNMSAIAAGAVAGLVVNRCCIPVMALCRIRILGTPGKHSVDAGHYVPALHQRRRLQAESGCGVNPPDGIPNIVGHQQSTVTIQRNANRPATGLSIGIEKPGQNIHRVAIRPAVDEWDEDHTIAARRAAVPGSMLANKRTNRERCRQTAMGRNRQP
jgi:hypothetical protein